MLVCLIQLMEMLEMNISPVYNVPTYYNLPRKTQIINRTSNYNNDIILGYAYLVSNISFQAKSFKVPNKLEKFIGCLMGGAIGDAMGAPIEFLKYEQIQEKYGEDGIDTLILDKNRKAYITDDTQMTLFTADGLIKSCLKNEDYNCEKEPDYNIIYNSYKDWHKCQTGQHINGGWISALKEVHQFRSPGCTCMAYTQENKEPGSISNPTNDRNGNGGIMRVAPIGLMYHRNPELAFKVGAETTALTHGSPNAYLSGGFQAALIAYILQGNSILASINKVKDILIKYPNHEDVLKKVNSVIQYAADDTDSFLAIRNMGRSSTGDAALGIALYCALKYPNNYEKAIKLAVNFDGDSDTIGSIVGNIVGASVGEYGIPAIWQRRIELSDEVYSLAEELYWGIHEIEDKEERYPIS